MKTKKTLLVLLVPLMLCVGAFAQNDAQVESVGLTDSDMKNFIKNYEKIDAELDKLNLDAENLGMYQSDEEKVEELEKLFRKYGISGPSAFAKVMVIYTDFMVEGTSRAFDSSPLMKSLMQKAYEDDESSGSVKDSLNQKDYALVVKYYPDLCKVFGVEEEPASGTDKSSAVKDEIKNDVNELGEEVKDAVKDEVKEGTLKAVRSGVRSLFK